MNEVTQSPNEGFATPVDAEAIRASIEKQAAKDKAEGKVTFEQGDDSADKEVTVH